MYIHIGNIADEKHRLRNGSDEDDKTLGFLRSQRAEVSKSLLNLISPLPSSNGLRLPNVPMCPGNWIDGMYGQSYASNPCVTSILHIDAARLTEH